MGKPKKSGFIPRTMPDKGKILFRFSQQGQKPLSQSELEGEFLIPREKGREFRLLLNSLVEAGEIRKVKGNKFVLNAAKELKEKKFSEASATGSEASFASGGEISGTAKFPKSFEKKFDKKPSDQKEAGLVKGKIIKQGGFFFVAALRDAKGSRDRDYSSNRKQDRARGRDRDRDRGRGANYSSDESWILVPKKNLGGARLGDIVSVRIISEEDGERMGKVVASLSQEIAFDDVSKFFFKEHGIPFGYPKEPLAEAAEFPEPVFEAYATRRDFRNTHIITIDPSTAKDHDDAISLEKLPNGNWNLGVHIADVAEYVTEDTALDEEAVKRAFTQYLPWTAAPMLPQRLSSDLCSLLEGRERLAFSCMMEVDPMGEVKKFDFVETFIRVAHFYSYEEAQEAKEAGDPFLILMDEFAGQLMARRRRDGFIDFQFPEPKVEMENGAPSRIYPNKRLASHSWIEECMLLANRATARFLMKNKLPGLFRVHEQPDLDAVSELWTSQGQVHADKGMLTAFKELSETGGFLNPAIQQFFIRLLSQEGGALPVSVQRKILQSMKKAQYSSDANGHFALGWLDYAHFTSPIRRYADLWTHRIIKGFVHGEKFPKQMKAVAEDIGQRISEREVAVMKVERKGLKTATSWILRDFVGEDFVGEISGLENFGLFVSITEPFGEGLIPMRKLRDDYYEKDENTGHLVGKRTRKVFALGDKIRVRLERSDPFSAQVDFEYLGPVE